MYNVVFEYDQSVNGFYGTRYYVDYVTKAKFEERRASLSGVVVVAENVTDDEAKDLICVTPEICRVLAALDDAFDGVDEPSVERTEWAMTQAQMIINMDRERILERGLILQDASKYTAHFLSTLRFDKSFLASSKRLLLAGANPVTGKFIRII